MDRGKMVRIVAALCLLLTAVPTQAQLRKPEKAKISAAADRASYAPGSEVRLAVVMDFDEGWHSNSSQPTYDYLIPTEASLELPAGWPEASVGYPDGVMQKFAFTDEPISVFEGRTILIASTRVPADAAPGEITLTAAVRYQACDDSQCLGPVTGRAAVPVRIGTEGALQSEELFRDGPRLAHHEETGSALEPRRSATPEESEESDESAAAAAPASTGGGGSAGLLAVLVLALLGGLVLNVMPCVLPVLSLKVFAMVRSTEGGRGAVTHGSLMTSLGILFSFWALALAAIVARAAGAAAGWGVQFQEPGFVAFLAVIVLLFSLNLWGLFEVPLPAFLANRLATTGTRQGGAGHFASGLFATLMATPCSAPFLGTAVTFALSQDAVTTFTVFTAIGLGMALPYLALAAFPGAARWLPRPGAWMETVKGFMGFLLAAAAIWLFYVLALQLSADRLAFIQLAVLGLALFIWLRRRSPPAADGRRLATLAGALVCIVLAIGLAATAQARSTSAVSENGAIAWIEFDRGEAERLAAEGQQVFVDVTAAWCLTCKFNERTVIETEEVISAFERHQVVPMKADWTNYDEDIRRFLEDYGRTGIPFYLLYRPGREPHVFGELLSKGSVLAALEEAG